MARIFMTLATLSLIACGGDKGGGTGTTGGDDGPNNNECTVTFQNENPADGTTDWYYMSALEVALSEADSTAVIDVADGSGAAVAGSTSFSEDGLVAYFTPDAPFAPSTQYTLTITTCGGEGGGSIGFATSELGTPLQCDITGKSFRVDLASARFLKPVGVADLLLGSLEDDILVGVTAQVDTSLEMIGALSNGAGAGQDYCSPTIPFPTASFDDPAFNVGPADTSLTVAGVTVEISQLNISGAFAPDCSYFGGGVLSGELDARVLGPVIEPLLGMSDPDQICGALAGFGVTCDACASDGQPYCAEVLADQITADTTGTTLSCVDETECHPSCATSTCDDRNLGMCE